MNIRVLILGLLLVNPRLVQADESRPNPIPSSDAAQSKTKNLAEADSVSDGNDEVARKSAERFLMVLERNPRKGTALDKVVEFHVDHESLDELITRLREKAKATEFEDAGRAWLVVGLVEASQGDAESAQMAFERAEELLPKNAVASFALGQNLMTLNRWPDAAAALERAIQRQPAPTDLLDVFQTLGRVQQRLAPGDKVVEVWSRLEKLVPNDPRVPELIAKTLLDDGHWEAALPRFEALAKATKDLYRRSEFELEAIDLQLQLGQFEKALAESDRLLGGLKQDHWLFRETRRRVEEAFLAKDDAAGLIKHYEERLVKQPEDLDAVVRLSRALVSLDCRNEARTRLEAGIKLAPSSADLRLELIELLQSDQQFAEAIAQYEQLDHIAPNNPDHIRDWGFLILKFVVPPSGSQATEEEDRLKAELRAKNAAAVWRKLVDAKPKDAVVAAQVAGLMSSAEKSLLDDAADLLRKAIELEPEALSHREQLGEVLDSAGKKDESLAAWRSMAEAPRRNANNLAQLAEVLSRFGYRDETLTTIDAACELDRKSLELRFQQAELRRKWKQFESAMSALAEAAALADTPETFDRVVQVEVKVLSESEMLTGRIEELSAARGAGLLTPPKRPTAGLPENDPAANKRETFGPDQRRGQETRAERVFDPASTAAQQFRLAKYLEAADKLREATVAARKAVELAPSNGVFIQAAARMLTLDSQWLSAVELYERLMKIDRRFRIDSLRSIAEVEQKLGRKDKALKAGRELLAAAPGNPESAEFVVDVCLRFGQNAEALQILRRASRQNVADKRLALRLVERLMEDGGVRNAELGVRSSESNKVRSSNSALRTPHSLLEEAREILWRVFEQTAKSDDRIEVIRKLAELSVFPGEFAKLVQRLERYRAEPKLRRDASLALVQVHEQAGDTQQARRELERWLPQAPRDPALLARMVSLCETAGDLEGAIAHQQRLAELTRRRETDEHLIVLLRRAGRDADADTLATRWLESERDPAKVLKEIDRLMGTKSMRNTKDLEFALRLSQALLDRDPHNLEFLSHKASALFHLNRASEAHVAFTEAIAHERDPAKVLRQLDDLMVGVDGQDAMTRARRELAIALSEAWIARNGFNWEFLSRKGFALHQLGRINDAHLVFDQVIALGLPDDTPSILLPTPASDASVEGKIVARVHRVHLRFMYLRPYPDCGAVRRLVLLFRKKDGLQNRSPTQPAVASPNAPSEQDTKLQQAWDEVYITFFDSESKTRHQAAMTLLARVPDDAGAQWLALFSLWNVRKYNHWLRHDDWQSIEGQNPLEGTDVDRLVAAVRNLRSCDEAMMWHTEAPVIDMVCQELLRSGRNDDLQRLLAETEEKSGSPQMLAWLLHRACRNGEVDVALRLLPKYAASFRQPLPPMPPGTPANAIWPAESALVACWLQHLIWRQIGADLSEQSPNQQALSATAKGNVLRIVAAAVKVFSDSRVPKPSLSFSATMTAIWQADKHASISNALLPSANPAGILGLGHEASLFWVSRNHLGRTMLPFPNSRQSTENCVLAVLLQASAVGGHSDTRKSELIIGSSYWQSELRAGLVSMSKQFDEGSQESSLAKLCFGSLVAWQGKSAETVSLMKELFEDAAHRPTLQLEIVSYFLKDNQQNLALDLLDRITTTDGQRLREIEQLAIQIAGKLGRAERVKLAAERLFGMKLEPAEELQLAATLSGLGLHEQAEAIRQRLPQRAGNNLAVLQQAMQERIDAKKIEEACQIAEQIVRRTSPANTLIGSAQQATFGGGQQARVITTTSVARTKALTLLGQQGRLGPLIEQAEQQFDRSPHSLKLFGQLAELYGAEGAKVGWDSVPTKRVGTESQPTNEKIAKLLVRLADSDAPDPQFRLTLARALVSAGKAQLAVPHFLFAIERLPNATAQVLFEAEQILSELGHVDALAAIVLKSKLAVNDQQRVELFRRIVQRLEGPPIRAKLIIQLFEKAFREAPDFRPVLAAQLLAVSGSVWQQEELWPIARDLVVPPADRKNVGAWYGIDISRLHNGKQIDSITRRTVELAAQLKKLDELATAAEAAMKQHSDWQFGGQAVMGFIRLRQGKLEAAKKHFAVCFLNEVERLRPLLNPAEFDEVINSGNLYSEPTNSLLLCAIALELARAGEFDTAARYYEISPDKETVLEHCRWFGKEPAMQQLAVRIVNRMLAGLDDPAELTRQASSPLFVEAAKITAEINQPYVAARLAQAMITRWQLPSANNSDGGTWLEQLEHRFANARAAIKPEMLPGILDANVDWTPSSDRAAERPSKRSDEGVQSTARFDLLTHVTGDSLTNLRLDSPFVPLLKEAAKDKDLWAKWTTELRRAEGRQPPDDPGKSKDIRGRTPAGSPESDLSLAILASLTELFTAESNGGRTSLPRLVEVAKSYLKTERPRTAPAGFHPQLGLWLIARECLTRKEHQKLGHELADLATESASLHFDPRFQWAILRERGELAHKAGDKELANKLWTRLAVDVLRPRSAEDTVPMLLGKEFVWSANWPSTRLHRARDLSRLTLNAEMSDLSLSIFRDAVNWPKTASVQIKFENDKGLTSDPDVISATAQLNANFMASSRIAEDILATWDTLEPEWRAKGVAAEAIFATLLECVLPTNRPDDVFVFAVEYGARVVRTPTSEQPNESAKGGDVGVRSTACAPSLALRLVQLAVAEKRIDTLTQRLTDREKNVTNPLALRLVHLLLARQTSDDQRLDAELTKLAQHDWSKPAFQNGRIATQIVWLLTPLSERREQVSKLFEQWIAPVSKAYPRDEHPVADLRRWLAKQQLDQQQTDNAKETISSHLRHMDQVWSATGAMDGQHLRRLELLAIATDYAAAGLIREAIDLLAQVADARWPDRYPDENPGAVLTILEAKLKSRPAQERYELWRTWSLPNDGVKSMRMLTGSVAGKSEGKPESEISNFKFQISNLRSTADLLVEAAREADRLAELDAFVEEQMKQRPSDRIHVLLALIHLANKVPAAAETLVRHQITLWESQAGKTNSATRTRVWDDWLLSEACSRHESLRELAEQLAKRAESGARELADRALLRLIGKRE